MATTVSAAFVEFDRNFVSLDAEKTIIARKSRSWLLEQLSTLPEKINDFPRLYQERHVHHGSFSRNTKIQPLDDIDLLLTFSGDGTTYDTTTHGKNYILRVPETATSLKYLCNEDGTLNSIKLVNKVVSSLNKIDQYKAAEKHRRGEAATLQLLSYEWNFDIVPSFYTDTGHYIIPDGVGGWKASDPRIDHNRIQTENTRHGGKVPLFVRKMKYWNNRAMMKTIPSYLLENIVISYCEAQESISEFIDINLINFWAHLSTAIYNEVPDPKGFQGNLNNLTLIEKQGISAKAEEVWKKGREAFMFETEEKNHQKAVNKWREIFGDNFPRYE